MPSRKAENVVELGCGYSTTFEIVRHTLRPAYMIGVDHSVVAVEKMREKNTQVIPLSSADAMVAKFMVADVSGAKPIGDIEDGWADFAYSSHVMEHFEDMYQHLDELHRIVRKNGVMAVTVPLHSYDREHAHTLSCDQVVGMMSAYARPCIVFEDGRMSELTIGIIKHGEA